jgi:hypothetical protein
MGYTKESWKNGAFDRLHDQPESSRAAAEAGGIAAGCAGPKVSDDFLAQRRQPPGRKREQL